MAETGETWEDLTCKGRLLHVESLAMAQNRKGESALHAFCTVIDDPVKSYIGRKTRIRADRLHDGSKNYRKVTGGS